MGHSSSKSTSDGSNPDSPYASDDDDLHNNKQEGGHSSSSSSSAPPPSPSLVSISSAKIVSIKLEHSNPSMGPHETRVSYTIQAADYPDEVQALLSQTQVNNINNSSNNNNDRHHHNNHNNNNLRRSSSLGNNINVTLGTYLNMMATNQWDKVNRVRQAYNPGDLACGSTISSLSFYLADGQDTLSLSDLRMFRLEGYYGTTFQSLLVEKGSKYVERPGDFDLHPRLPLHIIRPSSAEYARRSSSIAVTPAATDDDDNDDFDEGEVFDDNLIPSK
eukprot:TRINITY_DN5062_c0_g1_i2.p1 TRINITY_DN5062_c0_g1~~TRINITY_DN5062_c0_g1_i2.p1  ORF type:complete len:294 (+),score=84.58 TRINITY_DN5062_c0_g1_i2:58-882(+)